MHIYISKTFQTLLSGAYARSLGVTFSRLGPFARFTRVDHVTTAHLAASKIAGAWRKRYE